MLREIYHIGLMLTKEDGIFEEFMRHNRHFFDALVILDGGDLQIDDPSVDVIHESEIDILDRSDHGLRQIAYDFLCKKYGYENWVTMCHPDEFFYHDPRKIIGLANQQNKQSVWWYATHFIPHPKDRDRVDVFSPGVEVSEKFRYYHHNRRGTGVPHLEFRQFKNSKIIRWNSAEVLRTTGRVNSTVPFNAGPAADFHPIYQHYKVYDFDLSLYCREGGRTLFKYHWQGRPADERTGMAWDIHAIDDFFIERYEKYESCDFFDGTFDHPWNIGDEYR